jgi:chloramphenicol 3-O phosphotransferase
MIIFLNGTSSAGKTTLAKALQARLLTADPPRLYLHFSVDHYLQKLPADLFRDDLSRPEAITEVFMTMFPRLLDGFHRSLAAAADAGLTDLIVDHVLQERAWHEACVHLLADYPVLFVGVMCPLEELERREKLRPERQPGQARKQLPDVHVHGAYDLAVDTSVLTVEECVDRVLATLADPPSPGAFKPLAGVK